VLQAEAVAQAGNGGVVLAGYFANAGALAPALARFTSSGALDPSFGHNGTLIPRPSGEGGVLRISETGGEELHDVAVEPDGTIVAVGEVVPGHSFDRRSPRRRGNGSLHAGAAGRQLFLLRRPPLPRERPS
jgi:Domain of unknown function (DUF5122) beta-propeller